MPEPSSHSRIISLGNIRVLVVDLTRPLTLNQQGYPGDSPPERIPVADISIDGWHQYSHIIGDHIFQPHCDAPNHFQSDRQQEGMEIYDLSWTFHRACLIDLSFTPETTVKEGIRFLVRITREQLEPYALLLAEREALLIRTGYGLWLTANKPNEPDLLPCLEPEAALYLASFPTLRVIGLDSLTVDAYGAQASHLALSRKMILEGVAHLDEIPAASLTDFTLQTSPVRIVGATGGPVIAYAWCLPA